MKLPETLAFANGGALGAATRLADYVSAGWTKPQARAMREILWPDRPTHAKIAAELGISRQAVDQNLSSAGASAILDALYLIEEADTQGK